MDHVRLGLIGVGSMGNHHLGYLPKVAGLQLTAASDCNPAALKAVTDQSPDVKTFDSPEALMDSGLVDAVLIATPHYFHPTQARYAMERGLHVLTEKPVAVSAKQAQITNEVFAQARKKFPKLQFAGMFNQRTRPQWMQIKKMMDEGTLGELVRVEWVITNWFRSQAYYDSGGWRATWKGEGGGVLINQCPHNLDLFQWFVGMPQRLWTIAGIGKHHHIEVEDDITTMMSFANGATGTFVTSTGQAPGINRLTIVGTRGTLDCSEGENIRFRETVQDVGEFTRTTPERFASIAYTEHVITPPKQVVPEHQSITANFINVILGKEDKLIAPAVEGIHGLELGNAMLLSGLSGSAAVDLPTDRDAFEAKLQELIAASKFQKQAVGETRAASMAGTF
jgi:predicted dehydrogenase